MDGVVYVPIAPPERNKMGLQQRLGIYVGFDSQLIISFLEPLTEDLITAWFVDCHFDEHISPSLRGEKIKINEQREIIGHASSLYHLDPRPSQCELEVQRIIYLQNITN